MLSTTIKAGTAAGRCYPLLAILLLFCLWADSVNSFVPSKTSQSSSSFVSIRRNSNFRDDGDSAALSAFADSLERRDAARSVQPSLPPATTAQRRPVYLGEVEEKSWQASLEKLFDPSTPLSQRQILLSELLNANEEIRESVLTALRDRKIDPLLTPTGRKLQDGTRAVARQLTNDIIPALTKNQGPLLTEVADALPKVGSRILDALTNQFQRNLETFQRDLADPSRIPARITKQTEELVNEARNVFLETPEGYEGPSYTVVQRGDGYEIREYEGYSVASATVGKVGEPYSMDDVAASGAAFNTLAAYLFGANSQGKSMEMTTPVTTTSLGEMRFYLKRSREYGDDEEFPAPIRNDNLYDTGSVQIVDIQPARLAVRRFTGFVTEGEVARQKDVLLTALELDGVEIDVPHGSVVPHVIFQYNPPYTIPILRRNEIAVPVRDSTIDDEVGWDREWSTTTARIESPASVAGGDDISPSDV